VFRRYSNVARSRLDVLRVLLAVFLYLILGLVNASDELLAKIILLIMEITPKP